MVWHIPFIGDLYPLKDFGVKSLAIVIILSLTYLNVRSLEAGSYFQNLSTILKLLVIGALVLPQGATTTLGAESPLDVSILP